jgi:hypothetical protein
MMQYFFRFLLIVLSVTAVGMANADTLIKPLPQPPTNRSETTGNKTTNDIDTSYTPTSRTDASDYMYRLQEKWVAVSKWVI